MVAVLGQDRRTEKKATSQVQSSRENFFWPFWRAEAIALDMCRVQGIEIFFEIARHQYIIEYKEVVIIDVAEGS